MPDCQQQRLEHREGRLGRLALGGGVERGDQRGDWLPPDQRRQALQDCPTTRGVAMRQAFLADDPMCHTLRSTLVEKKLAGISSRKLPCKCQTMPARMSAPSIPLTLKIYTSQPAVYSRYSCFTTLMYVSRSNAIEL